MKHHLGDDESILLIMASFELWVMLNGQMVFKNIIIGMGISGSIFYTSRGLFLPEKYRVNRRLLESLYGVRYREFFALCAKGFAS